MKKTKFEWLKYHIELSLDRILQDTIIKQKSKQKYMRTYFNLLMD